MSVNLYQTYTQSCYAFFKGSTASGLPVIKLRQSSNSYFHVSALSLLVRPSMTEIGFDLRVIYIYVCSISQRAQQDTPAHKHMHTHTHTQYVLIQLLMIINKILWVYSSILKIQLMWKQMQRIKKRKDRWWGWVEREHMNCSTSLVCSAWGDWLQR